MFQLSQVVVIVLDSKKCHVCASNKRRGAKEEKEVALMKNRWPLLTLLHRFPLKTKNWTDRPLAYSLTDDEAAQKKKA